MEFIQRCSAVNGIWNASPGLSRVKHIILTIKSSDASYHTRPSANRPWTSTYTEHTILAKPFSNRRQIIVSATLPWAAAAICHSSACASDQYNKTLSHNTHMDMAWHDFAIIPHVHHQQTVPSTPSNTPQILLLKKPARLSGMSFRVVFAKQVHLVPGRMSSPVLYTLYGEICNSLPIFIQAVKTCLQSPKKVSPGRHSQLTPLPRSAT